MTHQQISSEDREYLKEMTAYRKGLYHLLSTLFIKEQNSAELEELYTSTSAACSNDMIFEGERAFLAFLSSLKDVDFKELAGSLRAEYARLFLGPRPKKAAPYESIYRGSPRRMFSDVTMNVRECYRNAGFEILAQGQEPDDHIGFELEFMRELCNNLAALLDAEKLDIFSVQKNIQDQKTFLSNHLSKWVGSFATKIRTETNQPYFVALADLLESFIVEDVLLIEECVNILAV
ncbi:MAG: molecular chaperone TorD family protein [Eggerthellaceae bacterium]|jgi:TorA maturation chaperone TorD|nr:molecular chaperone TorD family protein [Eggerthellaceae bacterium]MDR2721386.1 molecular chaperone TorD family protein [Coriobacteriaceae bacterium]